MPGPKDNPPTFTEALCIAANLADMSTGDMIRFIMAAVVPRMTPEEIGWWRDDWKAHQEETGDDPLRVAREWAQEWPLEDKQAWENSK